MFDKKLQTVFLNDVITNNDYIRYEITETIY